MNKSVKLNREKLIKKSDALSNLFDLAEKLGYPFTGVKLPEIHAVRAQFAKAAGFNNYNEILELGDMYQGPAITLGKDCDAAFSSFDFKGQADKEFANQMFEYILVDQSPIVTMLNAILIRPVDHRITQALINIDNINNIEAALYVHPFFLIEYYKAALVFQQLDYIDENILRLHNFDYLKEEFYNTTYHYDHISSCFSPKYPHPELQFNEFTFGTVTNPEFIQFNLKPEVSLSIIQYLGRNNIQKMSNLVPRHLTNIALVNLKHFKPNKKNDYLRECLKYRNNVNNDDQVITFDHDLFDHYFLTYYALEFVKAVQMLHNEVKQEEAKLLDLSIDDLTVDMFGRMTMSYGTKDMTKFVFRYLHPRNKRLTYEQGMAKIHSKIIANNSTGDNSSEFLSIQLVNYLNAIYSAFKPFDNLTGDIAPFINYY